MTSAPSLQQHSGPQHSQPLNQDEPLTVLRCETTADFLAALPRLVGFTAENSLYIVFFSGKRSGSSLRIDLPASSDSRVITPYVNEVMEVVNRCVQWGDPSAPALVIHSTASFAESGGAPWRGLARALGRRLERQGMRPRELCCLAPDGWVSYLDANAPTFGHALNEIAASSVADPSAAIPLATLGDFPEPDAGHRELVTLLQRSALVSNAMCRSFLFERRDFDADAQASVLRWLSRDSGWATVLRAQTALSMANREGAASQRRAAARLTELVYLSDPAARPRIAFLSAHGWWRLGIQSVALKQLNAAERLDPHYPAFQVLRSHIETSPLPIHAEATFSP